MPSRPELRLPSPSAVFDNDGGDGLLFDPHRAPITTTSDFASSHVSSMTKKRLNVSNDGRPAPATLSDGETYPVAGSSTCTITSNVARSSSKSFGTSIERRKVPSSKKEAVNPKSVQYDIAGKSRATRDVKLRKFVKTESSELDPFAHAGQTSSSQVDSSSSRKRRRPHDTDNAVRAPRLGRMKQEHGIEDPWDGDASFEACQAQLRQQSDTGVRQEMQMDMKANLQQPHQEKHHSLDTPNKTTLKTSQPATSSGKRTKKATIDPMYKRPARERTHCPKTVMDRLDRAMSQRMFMIERVSYANAPNQVDDFKVLGSTGNVYTVTIGNFPSCDCPDCLKGNSPCKHIIFVFLKVLKVPEHSSVWYQKGLTPAEVQWVFQQAPPAPSGSVAVHSSVRNAYLHATGILPEQATSTSDDNEQFSGKRIEAIGEDCPICYEEMTQQDDVNKKLVYDDSLGGCGRPSHAECFKMWAATAKKNGQRVTCVWCRNEWPTGTTGGKGKGKMKEPSYDSMGYLNMASIAGLRRTRDTSTYHRGWRYRNDDSEED
ncbi:hypothetical protein D1P53_006055 [Cryptococcus gattii VGV]|nr:hypothetical protein D1P53_006055 [Cryptococcus gattii VGV]